jgi:opacity protein-like surface antigen
MKKFALSTVILATLGVAQAENPATNGFSYDYVQGTYQSATIEQTIDGSTIGVDPTGISIGGSKLLTDNIFVTASYNSLTANSLKFEGTAYSVKTTVSGTSFGVGFRMPINEKIDFNVHVASIQGTTKASGLGLTISDTINGTPITAGVRFMAAPNVELQASYEYDDGDSSYFIGGGVGITKEIAIVGGYNKVDGGSSAIVGLRYNF